MKSYWKSKEEALKGRSWVVIDAANIPVGRVATEVASIIRGKTKVDFTPNVDGGDFVVVINASQIKFTGKKAQQKLYRHHTGFIGGLKETPAEKLLAEKPERVIRLAVAGMLPKGTLGRNLIKKLKIYRGDNHGHAAQKPVEHKLAAAK